MTDSTTVSSEASGLMERVLYEVKRVVVGQDHFLERVMVAMLATATCWSKACPGWPRRSPVKTLAQTLRGTFKRIQFTPDLVPADLVGTRIFNPRTGEFSTSLGPVFTHLLLADEINRAPAKVQSALLEVMQERQVTIAGETHKVPEPFLVMATQNPIETEGTYPAARGPGRPLHDEGAGRLPDRGRGVRDRPARHRHARPAEPDRQHGPALRAAAGVPQGLRRPVADEVRGPPGQRHPPPGSYDLADVAKYLTFGASPRATIGLIEGARALAFMRGRNYALPEDMTGLVGDVMRHRLVLSYEALAEGLDADAIIQRVMKRIPVPDKPLAPEAAGHGQG
jgi:MoxR-like ATPase